MITMNERPDVAERDDHAGLLTNRVEQDLADTLNEFGSQTATHEPEQAVEAPQSSFGYGIPMAGVRYYSFAPAG
ncbi:MAG: hypothetical protein F4X64_03160 [Chloroflexi bacterium]|nr:hypothetical protein [Chloroflexota bacterium]